MVKRKRQTSLWLTIAVCLMAILYASLSAQEDQYNGFDVNKALEHNSILQLKSAMDSAYSSVAAGFPSIEPILKKSCYDCHSDQTVYPWYYKIPTIDAMIDLDIKEARGKIDFSKGFPFGGSTDQLKLLRELREEVEENEMPLLSYRIMHWGTAIEDERQDSLFIWVDSSIARLERMYQSLGIPIGSESAENGSRDKEDDD